MVELAAVEANAVGQFVQQLTLEGAVGHQAPQWAGLAGHAGAAFRGVEVAVGLAGLQQKAAQRRGLLHGFLKSGLPLIANVAVGVVVVGQKQKLDAARVAGPGQGGHQCFVRGTLASGVAVKAKHHRLAKPKQQANVVGRAGGAQGGYGVFEAQLGQGHHVHIAFGDEHIALLANGGAAFIQAIQLVPFAKNRRFGRVEVFGLALVQNAAAKANALTFDVANREHDAVAKAVVALAFLGLLRGRLIVLRSDDHARLHHGLVLVVGEHGGQKPPARRRIAQAKPFGHLASQAAAFEVAHGAGGLFKLLNIGLAGLLKQVVE